MVTKVIEDLVSPNHSIAIRTNSLVVLQSLNGRVWHDTTALFPGQMKSREHLRGVKACPTCLFNYITLCTRCSEVTV